MVVAGASVGASAGSVHMLLLTLQAYFYSLHDQVLCFALILRIR